MSNDKEQGTSRWWEFYVIRYGMGTVIGAGIVYFLSKKNEALKPLLFGISSEKLDANLLLLLVGYGITYCYVASAPILVFHTNRFAVDTGNLINTNIFSRLKLILIPPIIIAPLIYLNFHPSIGSLCDLESKLPELFLPIFLFTLSSIIIWAQYLAIQNVLRSSDELFSFYEKLSAKRNFTTPDFLDSYRHMREHGNSFLIVFLEIFLSLMLVSIPNPKNISLYVAIIIIWIMPAAAVWLVGSAIERKLIDKT